MKQKWTRFFGGVLCCCLLAGVLPGRAFAAGFRDVPAGHWAGTSINRCAELGFFQGKTATTFGLGQTMTRSAAVVVLDRFFGWEDVDFTLPYNDVPADAWYADALKSAYAKGAVTAQNRAFRPADPITREELAVMLVRALGYTEVAGVVQGLPKTFTDINTNEGYIAMARDLGLVSGIRTDTFAPDNYATREQVAVILMRLYDKLCAKAGTTMGIVSDADEVSGLDIAAADAATITTSGTVKTKLTGGQLKNLRAAAQTQGVSLMLYASGKNFLDKKADAAAQHLLEYVEKENYAGLVLEVTNLTAAQREKLTAFVTDLQSGLGEKPLRLVVSAPAKDAAEVRPEEIWDYAALAAATDGLVLRVTRPAKQMGGFPVAPVEALEDVYWGLSVLRGMGLDLSEITLMLTSEGIRYRGTSEKARLSAQQVEDLRVNGWTYQYSERYGCAWLEKDGSNEAIWYLDAQGVEAHAQLLDMMGVSSVCLSEPAAASAELLAVMK